MPSTPDPVLDERYDELVALIRAAKPRASESLRERVRVLEAAPPPPGRRLSFPGRGAALVFAAVLFVAAVAFVGVRGDGGGDDSGQDLAAQTAGRGVAEQRAPTQRDQVGEALGAAPESATAPPPSGTRIQDYRAELTVRVEDLDALSRATVDAMRTARSLRGFVVTARYDQPEGGEGDSFLVVRVPIAKVQEAILRFSDLGTVVAQRITIDDLQQQLNRQNEAISNLRGTIARLNADLRAPDLTPERRAVLQGRLENAQEELARFTNARDATVQRGNLARVALTLTTRDAPEGPPAQPGYVERTLEDAVDALGKVVAWALYVLIVASPLVLLAAILLPLERRRRRRADQHLLERA
jgi:hypothetical protein